ncbi:MAG TPA: hypothetical protein VHT52_01930, partial [Stellaceae bacterium]|nr:hypothetical protein [Stellaceae bacterium]
CVDDTGAVAVFAVVGRGDFVETALDKEIGPGFQPVVVDCRGVGGVELRDLQQGAHIPVIRRHSDQKPRTAASVARVGAGWQMAFVYRSQFAVPGATVSARSLSRPRVSNPLTSA